MVKKERRGWVNTGAVNVMGRMSGNSDRPIDLAIGTSARMARQGNLPFVYAILLRRQMRLKLATDGKFSQLAQACGAFAKGGQRVDCVGG